MTSLQGKTVLVTGAARGIGRAIALRLGQDGARVVVAARSDSAEPASETIGETAAAVERAGGTALAVRTDLRDPAQIARLVARSVEHFGGIDAVIHNASHLSLTTLEATSEPELTSMLDVNLRGMLRLTQACLPYLKKAKNPHVLSISPPLSLSKRWLAPHLPYTLSKYAMTIAVLGLAEEFRRYGVAVNALWPLTVIQTSALKNAQHVKPENTRKPEIMGDAARAVLVQTSRSCTGNCYMDEEILRETGVSDFRGYAVAPGQPLLSDLFTD